MIHVKCALKFAEILSSFFDRVETSSSHFSFSTYGVRISDCTSCILLTLKKVVLRHVQLNVVDVGS